MSETQRFLLLSIFIGVFAGLLVTCFHVAIEAATWATLGVPARLGGYAAVLWPALGALVGAVIVGLVFRSASGSGINATKSAIYISDGYVPFSSVAGKFSACAISIGFGNPLGPEDPALQMGAGVASSLGRAFRLTREHIRMIAPVGAAAGIAAAFNTPITAVLFVIEEILAGWNAGVLGSIVLSAVSATVVSRWFLGDAPLFEAPVFTLTHPSELAIYALIGVAGGLLGAGYLKLVVVLRSRAFHAPVWTRFALPAAAGLVVGMVAWWLPQILGAGYPSIDAALHNEYGWGMLIGLGLVKATLTALCFAVGTPGGLFAPTLFVGAMVGGGIGALASQFWPFATSPTGAYVLVGMGTFFAAFFRTPMTSFFMIFEVSATYAIILPAMVANTLAYLVSRGLQPTGVFEAVARLEGTVMPAVHERRERAERRIEDSMVPIDGMLLIPAMASVAEVLTRCAERPDAPVLVAVGPERWADLPPDDELQAAAARDDSVPLGRACSLTPARVLFRDEEVDDALEALAGVPVVPVVTRTSPRTLLGCVTLDRVLETFGHHSDRQTPGTRSQGTGVGRQESGDRSQETGDRRRDTGQGPE